MEPLFRFIIQINLLLRILTCLSDIYYGRTEHEWAINIEDWKLSEEEQISIDNYQKTLLELY